MTLHCKPPYATTIYRLAFRLDLKAVKLTNTKLKSIPFGKKMSYGVDVYYKSLTVALISKKTLIYMPGSLFKWKNIEIL